MNEPKIATSEVVMCDADYDAEVRFAGAGVLRDDTEYQYPPAKWGESSMAHKIEGPPYEVKSVTSWPAEVDRRLSHIEALVHKAINPPALPPEPDYRSELQIALCGMRMLVMLVEECDRGECEFRPVVDYANGLRTKFGHKWNGGL